jgi:hypothetical protein
MPLEPVTRRAFLAATGGLVVAAAVGGPAGAGRSVKNRALSPVVLSSDLYASPEPQRLAFAIYKGSTPSSSGSAKLALAPPGATEGTVYATTLQKAGLPKGRGVYVADALLPTEGVWKALAITHGKRVPFAVQVNAQPIAPAVGAPAPRAASPTKADPLGVKPICTRTPPCPLHTVSLSEVVGTGRPVAVLFATPALCQSQYCGPVLDELLKIKGPYEDRVTFVHVDIYRSSTGAELSPTVEAWGLESEPWLYTVDGAGSIVGRLDGAFGGDEMTAQLDALVGV